MGVLEPIGPRVVGTYEYTTDDGRIFAVRLQVLNSDLCLTKLDPVMLRASEYKPRGFECRRLYCFRVDPVAGRVFYRAFIVDTFTRAQALVFGGGRVSVGGQEWTPYKYKGEYNA